MVQVTYQGGGMDGVTSNAASEATLQALLKALGSGGGGGAGGAQDQYTKAQKAGILGQKNLNKETKGTTESVGGLGNASNKASRALKSIGGMAKGVLGMAVGAIGNTGQAAADMGMELLAGGNKLSDFSQHATGLISKFPIIGGALGTLGQGMIELLDGQIDSFRNLSSTGVDFGGSMFEIMDKATQTGLSMEVFAGSIAQGSQNLAMMFGGTTAGAQAFTKLQIALKPSIKQLTALGYTMEEVGEFTNDYLELQRIQGRTEGRTSRSLAQGTADYMKQLDMLAKVTGMSRKEAAAALKEQSTDKRLQSLFASLDDVTKGTVENVLATMGNVGPEFKDALTEIVATGGAPLSDYAKGLVATMPEVGEAAAQLKSGSITQDQFMAIMQEAQKKAQENLKNQGENISTYMAMGNTMYNAQADLAKAGGIAGKKAAALEEQKKALSNAERGNLLNFGAAIQNARNTIMNALIKSGIFDKLQSVVAKVTPIIEDLFGKDGTGTKAIGKFVDKISTTITKFIADFQKMTISELVSTYIFTPIKNAVMGMFGGGDGDKKEGGKEGDSGKPGMFDGITGALKSIGKYLLIGGVAMGAMFVAMAVGLTMMGPALAIASPGLLAFGVAVASIGVAGAGISLLIDSIANSVGTMADGAKKFEELDGGKLTLAGAGLKAITGPVMDLAKGGIVASFIGTGAFTNLANGIKEFEGVNAAGLFAVGPALTSLHKGMSAFTGDGLLDSIGKSLGSLFGGSSGGLADLADDVKLFADVDSAGLKAIGDGLQGIANFIDAMDGANLKSVSKSIVELTKQLGAYQKEYNKMDADAKANLVNNFSAFGEGQKGAGEKLDSLNSSMQSMLMELRKITSASRTTADSLG